MSSSTSRNPEVLSSAAPQLRAVHPMRLRLRRLCQRLAWHWATRSAARFGLGFAPSWSPPRFGGGLHFVHDNRRCHPVRLTPWRYPGFHRWVRTAAVSAVGTPSSTPAAGWSSAVTAITSVTVTGVSCAGWRVTLPLGNLTPRYGFNRAGDPMPGPIKPPDKRINRVTKNVGVVRSAATKRPPMPRGLCPAAKDAWATYFADVVSGVLRPCDGVIVLRWIANVDRYLRLISEADRAPLAEGSTGQDIPHPLYGVAFKLEASIRADEQQLGVGPANRLKLGAQFSEAARTLAEINPEAHDGTDDDPRAAIIALAGRHTGTSVEPGAD